MWKFQGCVEIISRVFQENFEGVSGVFLWAFEACSKEFLEGFKEVLRYVIKVSRVSVSAIHTPGHYLPKPRI